MGHTLVAVDVDGLGLNDNVLLSDQTLVLQVFQRVLRLVQLLLQGIADPHQLVTLAHQTNNTQRQRMQSRQWVSGSWAMGQMGQQM